MQEELFTCEELERIIQEAENPVYLEPNLVHLGSKKLSVNGVSSENGLILAYMEMIGLVISIFSNDTA